MKRVILMILSLLLLCSCASGVTPSDGEIAKSGYLHAEGRLLISPDGEEVLIKGMALGNDVWGNPSTAPTTHHNEDTYRELSEMGFNSVRFYLNYGLFEDDSEPYKYKESGFDWIDKNIKWAKKYNMGIILNMHYPQGGYHSQAEGLALWDDASNQDRLSSLWCEIAKRYDDEPTIWGYGLINEPIISWQGDKAATLSYFQSVMQRLTDDIRQHTNKAIIVERLLAVVYSNGVEDWNIISTDESLCMVKGENIIYEFHDYSPYSFTHQDLDWADTKGATASYPNEEEYSNMNMTEYWVDCLNSRQVGEDGDWQYREATRVYNGDEKYNVGVLAINAARLGADGAAYFDDMKVTEISPEGEERVIIEYKFDTDTTGTIDPWSEDGSGTTTYSNEVGYTKTGSARVAGTTGDYTINCGQRFVLKEGYTYKVSGYVKLENCKNATVRIDFGHASSWSYLNKEYLESELMPYIQFSEKNNVPIYMGEFGVCANGFLYARGGNLWVRDMLELCREHNLSFNYHAYHEGSFGLYMSGSDKLPALEDRNQALYDCLVEELAK